MIKERNLINKFDTKDTKLIHSTNPVESKLQWLRGKFNKRCLKGCYILDVIKLTRHTPWTSEWNRSGGAWYTSVEFTVKTVVYDHHEVIIDAVITAILENGMFILTSEYASIGVMPHKDLQTFKVGQKMPVVVETATYTAYEERISCTAKPLIPQLGMHLQKYRIVVSQDDIDMLKPLVAVIDTLHADIKLYDSATRDRYNMFKSIMYPYKKEIKATATPIVEVRDSVVCMPEWLDIDQPVCIAEPPGDYRKVENGINILREYLNSVIKNIEMIMGLTQHYTIDDSTKHIWQTYIKYRLDTPELKASQQQRAHKQTSDVDTPSDTTPHERKQSTKRKPRTK